MSRLVFAVPARLQPIAPTIAYEYALGATYLDLADKYATSSNTISAILREQGITPRSRGVAGDIQRARCAAAKTRTGRPVGSSEGQRAHCQTMGRPCVFSESDGHCPACAARYSIEAGISGSSTGSVELVGCGR